jgi:hypothetical protein
MYQQQQQQNDQTGMRGGFNLLTALIHGHAMTCTIFMRSHLGRDSIGFAGMFGFFMMLVYGGLMNSYPMFIYLCLYLLAVLCQRMKTYSNWRKGIIVHSRSIGYPWLAFKLFPRIKTENNARGAEAFLCLAVGWLLMTYVDQPLGWWVMFGWVSIMATESMIVEVQRRRLQAMRDAEIEQSALADAYREGRF